MADTESPVPVEPNPAEKSSEQQAEELLNVIPPEEIDFYISYRENDAHGHSDKDIASRLAGALQKERTRDGDPVTVFAPDGDAWEVRLKFGLKPAKNILLVVSEGGMRQLQEAHRAEDITLLEYEYALGNKLRGKKKVLLLLCKDGKGNNFSSFSTEALAHDEVTKIAQDPCHKSKLSAALWDDGAKGDLLFRDRKAGEHSVRETIDEMLRLSGVNISAKSADVKAVVPGIIAMLRLQLPELPEHRVALSKNWKVEKELDKLSDLLASVGEELVAALPLLRPKFGVGSVEDLAALSTLQLSETLQVDRGRVILADKNLGWVIVDNGVTKLPDDLAKPILRKLKLLELVDFLPQNDGLLATLMPVGGILTTSTVEAVGREIKVGNESKIVKSVTPALVLKHEREDGTILITEITDEMIAKMVIAKDKGAAWERPEGTPCVHAKVEVDSPWSSKNTFCDAKGHMKDVATSREVVDYSIETRIKEADVTRLHRATQTALGKRPGEVSLAQSYGNLFEHRIRASVELTDLNSQLMNSIKAQDVKAVIEVLKKGASCNFKDGTGWTPLQRACAGRVDTCDLGMNFIACNQIIEVLIKAGGDVNQTNGYGRTALHYAAMEGNYYAVSLLVHAGAPVDAKDNATVPDPLGNGIVIGANAAFHARLMRRNEWEKVVALLDLYSDEPKVAPPDKGKKGAAAKKGKKKK